MGRSREGAGVGRCVMAVAILLRKEDEDVRLIESLPRTRQPAVTPTPTSRASFASPRLLLRTAPEGPKPLDTCTTPLGPRRTVGGGVVGVGGGRGARETAEEARGGGRDTAEGGPWDGPDKPAEGAPSQSGGELERGMGRLAVRNIAPGPGPGRIHAKNNPANSNSAAHSSTHTPNPPISIPSAASGSSGGSPQLASPASSGSGSHTESGSGSGSDSGFEDVGYATKTLNEVYGNTLRGLIEGGGFGSRTAGIRSGCASPRARVGASRRCSSNSSRAGIGELALGAGQQSMAAAEAAFHQRLSLTHRRRPPQPVGYNASVAVAAYPAPRFLPEGAGSSGLRERGVWRWGASKRRERWEGRETSGETGAARDVDWLRDVGGAAKILEGCGSATARRERHVGRTCSDWTATAAVQRASRARKRGWRPIRRLAQASDASQASYTTAEHE
ncbi:hypothetical protein B0H14DRAFT_2593216 [Mycena olivaceomarginata]|nr:hypothetical protein B0H14DRAFT_2593216 [Mycena olivaceomarginata]